MKSTSYWLFILLAFLFFSCNQGETTSLKEDFNNSNFDYTGNSSCAECHEMAFNNWKGSDHDKAMAHATDSSVLGDFDEAIVYFRGIESRFYKIEDKFYVHTAGPEGKMGDFEVKYTFGHWPLQQYLIPFEKGRLQCLPIAWDGQTESWFHLADSVYTQSHIPSTDWLYWTNNGQNWNGMCAECHSTNLNKNYNVDNQEYTTEWSEINVSCEACHGPASKHLLWTEMNDEDKSTIAYTGFPAKSIDLNTEELLNQCAYCHARRSSFDDFDYNGEHYLNQFTPQLVDENYYYFDGQIKEEDYVFTSFTQSRMHTRHVKCSECHEPHNLRTKQQGNLLCLQCHDHKLYDTKDHHFHDKTGTGQSEVMTSNGFYDVGDGTQCVDCHMTGAKFMGVDFRRDHNFRNPRPDVSERVGSPDACTSCHKDMKQAEAFDIIKTWYPETNYKEEYGDLYFRISKGDERAVAQLIPFISDTSKSSMVRASAIAYISRTNSMDGMFAIEDAVQSEDPLVRYSAIENYWSDNPSEELKYMKQAINDSLKSIRISAVRRLLSLNYQASNSADSFVYKGVIDEYLAYLNYGADFAISRHNLGVYYANNGDDKKAIRHLKEAVKIDDQYFPAMLELAVLYSRQGNNVLSEKWLLYSLSKNPDDTRALLYISLLKAEMKEYDEAAKYMGKLIRLDPYNSRNYYNLAFVQQERNELLLAEEAYINALTLEPSNKDYLYASTYFYLNSNQFSKANTVLNKMIELYPQDPLTRQLLSLMSNNQRQ